ncbi:hypothetical protein W02_10660 [Nitrospira sp. KM1]|nr:hypothetical protein W02_10660 [Nitrospira sp. KM1]
MATQVQYKNHTIVSLPHWHRGLGWIPRILISKAVSEILSTQEFRLNGSSWPTEHEADVHGVTYGQRIINGEIVGVNLMDMYEPPST